MKRLFFVVLVGVALCVTGCDMFRKMAGRPTSEQIAQKKVQIQAHKAELEALRIEQARLEDSIATARRDSALAAEALMARDSVAVLDSIRNVDGMMINTATALRGLSKEYLDSASCVSHYYIVIGSFKEVANAENLCRRARGYSSELVRFKNGLVAVTVCPSNRICQLYDWLKVARREKFFPKEAWLLINE